MIYTKFNVKHIFCRFFSINLQLYIHYFPQFYENFNSKQLLKQIFTYKIQKQINYRENEKKSDFQFSFIYK